MGLASGHRFSPFQTFELDGELYNSSRPPGRRALSCRWIRDVIGGTAVDESKSILHILSNLSVSKTAFLAGKNWLEVDGLCIGNFHDWTFIWQQQPPGHFICTSNLWHVPWWFFGWLRAWKMHLKNKDRWVRKLSIWQVIFRVTWRSYCVSGKKFEGKEMPQYLAFDRRD